MKRDLQLIIQGVAERLLEGAYAPAALLTRKLSELTQMRAIVERDVAREIVYEGALNYFDDALAMIKALPDANVKRYQLRKILVKLRLVWRELPTPVSELMGSDRVDLPWWAMAQTQTEVIEAEKPLSRPTVYKFQDE